MGIIWRTKLMGLQYTVGTRILKELMNLRWVTNLEITGKG
jgi:hypothetical protein